jgi:beta-lactamase class A
LKKFAHSPGEKRLSVDPILVQRAERNQPTSRERQLIVSMTRRTMTVGMSAFFGVGMTTSLPAAEAALAAVERRYGGRLGVFAVETESGRTLAHRADERFLVCSTFKSLLAAQVLSRVDSGEETLTRLVPY